MSRRRITLSVGLVLLAVTLGLVIRNQVRVYLNRQIRASEARTREAVEKEAQALTAAKEAKVARDALVRRWMFASLKPVALANCRLERFGEAHDGGYLMCANLLRDVRSGYSYGISGYDKWGCDVSTKLRVPLHQYDCFDTTRPVCRGGNTMFHEECVGASRKTEEGRLFDTIANQIGKNGDRARRLVVKIDVEGAEWDSFLHAPDDVLGQIDQMAVEFHGVDQEKYIDALERLRQFFVVAHVHFNNYSCQGDLEPFPSWAYEVLFVSRRLAVVDPRARAGGRHPLDAPNNASQPDCQVDIR